MLAHFYPNLGSNYPWIKCLAPKMISVSGSSYAGEQLFSMMNFNNFRLHSQFNDMHLNLILKVDIIHFSVPNLDAQAHTNQCATYQRSITLAWDCLMKVDRYVNSFTSLKSREQESRINGHSLSLTSYVIVLIHFFLLYLLSYHCSWERPESSATLHGHELKSRVYWDIQPWLTTSPGEGPFLVQNRD